MTTNNKIQVRRATAAAFTLLNPVLADGEPGLETDTRKIKYGNGSTPWINLPYSVVSPSDIGLGNVPNVDARARSTHTGTQNASTISDFSTAVNTIINNAGSIVTVPEYVSSNWSMSSAMPNSQNWNKGAYGNNIYVVIVTGTATNVSATSTDGITWTLRTLPVSLTSRDIIYANGLFIILFQNTASYLTSPDGITWTQRTLPVSGVWTSAVSGNGLILAFLQASATYVTSVDGITWTSRTLPGSTLPTTLVFSSVYAAGIFLVVTSSTGQAYGVSNTSYTSVDGINWTQRTLPALAPWATMKPVYGNGLFVIASWYNNQIFTSPDGITWTQRSFPIARGWNSLAVGNNTFVIVSDQNVTTGGTGPIGTSLISTNGITWVEKSLNNGLSNSWWNGLFFGNNKFLVFAGITSQIVAILSPSSLGTAKDLLPSLIENIVPVKNGFVTGSSMVGIGASADRYGMRAGASGFFTSTGDAQAVQFVLRNKTTNATPTTLFLDGVSTRLTIPSGKALFAHVIIAGIRSDGVTAAHYQRKVGIKNVGGTTSLLDTQPSIIGTDFENTAGYDVTITADDTNDALQINVTGAASETIRWVAVVDGVEIRYGT